MQTLECLLRKSSESHTHLCPRQILGVRIGLAGMNALGFSEPPAKKQLLIISETDGCFLDGITAATGCTVGHRTLRVEDYGKVAATVVETDTCLAFRIAPMPDIRERAYDYAPEESRRYFAQMRAYQIMPDDELLKVDRVELIDSIDQIISRPGVRVNCDECGEEILNNRESQRDELTLCRTCAGESYYRISIPSLAVPSESLAVNTPL